MRHRDTLSGTFWLCLGILISFWSTSYRIGDLAQPGPGFFPLFLEILLILLALALLIQATRAPRTIPPAPALRRAGGKKVLSTVSLMLLAIFLFEPLGYLLTFFLLMILLMRGGGTQRWTTTLLIAFFSTLGVYLIFVRLLKQPLSKGLLGI